MKKTFKDLNTDELNSPAMAFITPSPEPKAKEVEATEPPAKPKAKAKVNKPETKPAQTLKEDKETKSKRLNLLIQPSVLEDFSKVAFMERNSMNDIINGLIKSYCDAHREEISTYDKYFNKGE